MDEAIRKSIEGSIITMLQGSPGGLATRALTECIDEAETPAQVSSVLNDMSRRGLVAQDKESKRWHWAADDNAHQAAPAPEKKRHEIAEAILACFAGHVADASLTTVQLMKACSQHPPANVRYHIRALAKAGLLVPARKPRKGWSLASGAQPAPARAKPVTRRPNTALLPGAPKHEAPAPTAIPPAAPASSPVPLQDITVTLNCPAGYLSLTGPRHMVFGMLDQLKELAA